MSFSLLPSVLCNAITDLSVDRLQELGIKLLMLDFDNTIVPYTTDVPTAQMLEWLEKIKQSDMLLCVVSNSRKDRVKEFCACYGIDCITHAKKPFSKGIRACMARYGVSSSTCALAGDQIFTDVLGANGVGVRSILVKAIDNHNFWLKARHVLELPFIYAARKRRIENEKS